MKDIDFSSCEFIDSYMRFLTYHDFCDNCETIKSAFNKLDKNTKRFYKWYIYANIHIDEVRKGIIWEYLNYDEPEFYQKLLFKKKSYKVK